MKFTEKLVKGKLIKRYKRFFVDVKLNKETITAHCPNTGSMMGLLNENNWQEIAHAYNISIDTIEEIITPPHSNLDFESLSFLFEILREQPQASAKKICLKAGEVGLSIPEIAVNSYRNRLKLLGKI